MNILTGFGYYVQNGLKISKYELPVGNHPDPDTGITFVEVASQAALNAIVLDTIPLTVAQQKAQILAELADIDSKSIRAIRTGDTARMASWEAQAATLRTQLAALGS